MFSTLVVLVTSAPLAHAKIPLSILKMAFGIAHRANNGRRLDEEALDASVHLGLCSAVNEEFRTQYMDDFVDHLMQPGDNSEKLATLAEAMADWCHTTAVENRRRRLSDEYSLAQDFIKWIDDMEVRRLEGEDQTAELP